MPLLGFVDQGHRKLEMVGIPCWKVSSCFICIRYELDWRKHRMYIYYPVLVRVDICGT